MSELGSSEKNNMKYWLCDQYYNTTVWYDVHINKTLRKNVNRKAQEEPQAEELELVLYLFSRKEEIKVDKVQFYFHTKFTMLSNDNIDWQFLLVLRGKLGKNSWF